uniref:Uncharacterized protein n=1 Tax=Oryza meridionalis TaxID=40149 RepID=A0A0E0EPM4_9ORYZ
AAARRCGSAGRGGHGAGVARRRPGKTRRNSGDPSAAAAARGGARASSAAGQCHGRARLQGDRAVELAWLRRRTPQVEGSASFRVTRHCYRREGLPWDGETAEFDGARRGAAETGAASGRRCSQVFDAWSSSFSGSRLIPTAATATRATPLHTPPPTPAEKPYGSGAAPAHQVFDTRWWRDLVSLRWSKGFRERKSKSEVGICNAHIFVRD